MQEPVFLPWREFHLCFNVSTKEQVSRAVGAPRPPATEAPRSSFIVVGATGLATGQRRVVETCRRAGEENVIIGR